MARLLLCSLLVQFGQAHHPQYALVDGEVETMWQRPEGPVKGIFFIAHGCKHQGPDVFTEVTETGERFEECAKTNFGKCLGLPEEVHLRRYALKRGYVVMSVSGGEGVQSCWYGPPDVEKVGKAVAHVREKEKLPSEPLLALGASSGGAFVGLLPGAKPQIGLGKLSCIVPEIMGVDTDQNEDVPTLFIHMSRDQRTAAHVAENIQELKSKNVRVSEIRVEPQKVTPEYLKKCVDEKQGQQLVKAYEDQGIIDSDGFLTSDARRREWTQVAKEVLGEHDDSFVPDESCMSELMNVAWAQHEFTSQFAQEVFDFCEGKEIAPSALLQSNSDAWTTDLGPMEVFQFGEADGKKPLAVAIHGMAKSLVHEWDHSAKELAQAGYYVLVPNFHSLSGAKPGTISDDDIKSVVQSLMAQSHYSVISLLLGKSWGGGVASQLAAGGDFKVKKLVLVAPAKMLTWPSSCDVALFWAEDDPVVPIKKAQASPELLKKLKFFHTEKTGGHRVLDSYIPVIRDFALGKAEAAEEVELLQTNSRTGPEDFKPMKIFMILMVGVALPTFMFYKRCINEKSYDKRSPRAERIGAKE